MKEEEWLDTINHKGQMEKLIKTNDYTKKFGLILTEQDAALLLKERKEILKNQERVEFGEGILEKLIFAFCDSPYFIQDNFTDSLGRLQEIFYYYKNESLDEFTDDELIEMMKDQFDGPCQGSLDYLEDTGLARIAKDARFGFISDEEDGEDENV